MTRTIEHRAIGLSTKASGSPKKGNLLAEFDRFLEKAVGQQNPPVARVHLYEGKLWDLLDLRVDLSMEQQFEVCFSTLVVMALPTKTSPVRRLTNATES